MMKVEKLKRKGVGVPLDSEGGSSVSASVVI